MTTAQSDIIRGTADMLILKLLEIEPTHGWGLGQAMQRLSRDALRIQPGALYAALHRLTREGWIGSEWRVTENGQRARYYRLTAAGRRRLAAETKAWKRLAGGVALILVHALRITPMWRWLHDLLFRGRAVFDRNSADRELDEELQFHRSMDIESLRERGLSASQAEWEAGRHFGTLASEAERAREGWGVSLLEEFIADARHALRQLQRSPGIFRDRARGTRARNWRERVAGQRRRQSHASPPALWKRESRARLLDGRQVERRRVRLSSRTTSACSTKWRSSPPMPRPYAPSPGATGATVLPFVLSTSTMFDVLGAHPALGRIFDANDDRRWRATRDRHQ